MAWQIPKCIFRIKDLSLLNFFYVIIHSFLSIYFIYDLNRISIVLCVFYTRVVDK